MNKVRLGAIMIVSSFLLAANGAKAVKSKSFARESPRQRIERIDAAKEGELRLRPTFVSCGFSFGAAQPVEGAQLEFREKGAAGWTPGKPALLYFKETKDYRGSILDLKEDTQYEMRLVAGGKAFAEGSFRTWASEVPVARTVVLDPDTFKTPFVISDRGTADGWIRYTAKKGSTLRNTNAALCSFAVTNAAYVLIDDIILRDYTGESRWVVTLSDSENVRVRNCDFAGWGRRPARVDYSRLEWLYGPGYGRDEDKNGQVIDYDGAVTLGHGAQGAVIERCWFHDAVPNSCSWYYSHPKGPQAIVASGCGPCTVIRWNDFTGSDDHRWNDAIEGPGNFVTRGGLNRDADIYGNFFMFANDDGIEMDGGQQNLRCFGNRFEACNSGVSVQGCMVSPSYVYDNMISSLNNRFGPGGQTIKLGGGGFGPEATTFIWGNLLWGVGSGMSLWPELRVIANRNIFCGTNQVVKGESPVSVIAKDNVFGANVAERDLDPAYPKRPTGFVLDCVRRSDFTLRGGKLSSSAFTVTAKAVGDAVTDFTVAQDLVMDWLDVSPKAGRIAPGADVKFTVRLNAEKMRGRRHWRACFLVRGSNGLSRPVSILAEDLDYESVLFPAKPGEYALYSEPFSLKKGGKQEWTFDVPRAGRYWIYIHGTMSTPDTFGTRFKPHLRVLLDGAPVKDCFDPKKDKSGRSSASNLPSESVQYVKKHPTWSMVVPNHMLGRAVWHWDFDKPGRHTLSLTALGNCEYEFDRLALTDAPRSFETEAESRRRETVFLGLPEKADPARVSRIVTEQFLRTQPESYCPPGYSSPAGYAKKGYGGGKYIQYSVASIWVNALECARYAGHKDLEEKLIRLYDDYQPGGPKNACCSHPYHVDFTVFGAVPYQIYLQSGNPVALAEGNRYADTQWEPPSENTLNRNGSLPMEEQQKLWKDGYTAQTRLWIDDMYMIIALQSQAYKATHDRKYIDRTAREMCLYLDKLQLKDGPAKGLFYHAPDVPYVWGRGDGWMAAGMTLVLKTLPKDSEYRARIMEGYLAMMSALLKYQRADGQWSQLVTRPDDPRNWAELSCTGMFAYAFISGVRQGWLDPVTYGAAARKAWIAICESLDEYGNVPDVCCGTNRKDDAEWYFNRPRINGDPHGQAPVLWCAGALLEQR